MNNFRLDLKENDTGWFSYKKKFAFENINWFGILRLYNFENVFEKVFIIINMDLCLSSSKITHPVF